MEKVTLLMSGGVDSSYSAFLLSREFEVNGIYLKLHDNEKKHKIFIDKCQIVAEKLGINFGVMDLRDEFKKIVYDYFINSYKNAQTPNPCAMCNPYIKFGLGLKIALESGAKYIASGHYANIFWRDCNAFISEARDKNKDQSYFLFGVPKNAREKLLFPLGNKLKNEVKKEAFAAMPWFGALEDYKDSQEICFVEKDYITTLARELDVNKQGEIKNKQGEIIGTHKGYMHYTIGKRKGLDIPLSQDAKYVIAINADENSLIVGDKNDLAATQIISNIQNLDDFKEGDYFIKIRYKSTPARAKIEIKDDRIIANLYEPIYGVAVGQAMVIYDENVVLGGGFIQNAS